MKGVSPHCLCVLAATAGLAWAACAIAATPAPVKGAPVTTVSRYRTWQRVNSKTFLLPVALNSLCAMAAPRGVTRTPVNPHQRKYFTVYVNAAGRHAMMQEQIPKFPPGSVIVKEKLFTKNATAPELLTVMVKREPGYSPDGGDWEYQVFNGQGTKRQGAGKLENCQSCHALNKQTDYVFRDYLSQAVQKGLK